MFLAIIGAILVVVAVAILLGVGPVSRAMKSSREEALTQAKAALEKAESDYAGFSEWYGMTQAERRKHPRNDYFDSTSSYGIRDAVRIATNQVAAAQNAIDVKNENRSVAALGAVVALIIGVILIGTQSFYRQDIGEAKVQVSWSGQLAGQTTTPGFHLKAPWVSARTFDVRNNLVTYVGSSEDGKELPNYAGNVTTGPQITFQDKEGVTGNLDLTLRYSIEPGSVLDVYSEFGTQENFVNKVISEGVRAEARVAPSTKGTLEVYSDRAGLSADIMAGLERRWAGLGIIIEDVAVQEIRYSKDVQARFDDAQAARIAITKAEADQEAATVTARTKVIEAQGVADAAVVAAQGQAEANELLTESLTEQVLQQRWIDALKEGTVYVVPPGSTPFITTK